ncbi:MAG: hypothetical protein U0P45_13600 [Acidimicrobiales bacterium]
MDPVDLDALAAKAGHVLDLDVDEATEAVVTLAEFHDRRAIAPLLDLIASRRANELMIRAAGWMADPALHRALVKLRATRVGDLGDPGYWEQVDRAIGRCRPEAADEAEDVEVALLAATQAALLESGLVELEVELVGSYPSTMVVVRYGEHQRRTAIWNFDEASPDDPASLDRSFAVYRIAHLATWG